MNALPWAAILLQMVVAGATFQVASHALAVMDPVHLIHWRVQSVALLFLMLLVVTRRPLLPPKGSRLPLLLMGLLCFLTGVQLFCFGLLAELQMRTYHESQNRPIYRVRQTMRGSASG